MIVYAPPSPARQVPVIDLSGTRAHDEAVREQAAERVAGEIHRACRTIGFFYVIGHGIEPVMVDRAMAAAKAFFDLPLEQKNAIHMRRSPSSAGYEPIAAQVLNSQDPSAPSAPPDLKESFYCGLELPATDPWSVKRLRGYGHNQWPQQVPAVREALVPYYAEMSRLGLHLLQLLARSLEIEEDWFQPFFDPPSATLRLIKYPPQPVDAHVNQIGAGAHTDWGGVTILAQDDSGGLEVRNLANEWIDAPPIDNAFVINLGDLMARWTNGVYASNMHRVKNHRSGGDRYSIPFFMSPRPDARIEAIRSCVSADRPQRYAACTAAEHMNEMFRRSYGYSPTERAPA
jgi:isopenicillin N synthase-like dioxygenase